MVLKAPIRWRRGLVVTMMLTSALGAVAQPEKPRKVFMITDMEGVDGIFSTDLQCIPFQSPRFEESKKLLTGEVNAAVDGLLAGAFGVPVIMLSGDTAACKEISQLVPQAECAEVKTGVSRTAGVTLAHPAACALIRQKSQRAMERLAQFKPYVVTGPVEVKVEFTPKGASTFGPREGVKQVNERTWVFRGKDIIEAWLKYSSF